MMKRKPDPQPLPPPRPTHYRVTRGGCYSHRGQLTRHFAGDLLKGTAFDDAELAAMRRAGLVIEPWPPAPKGDGGGRAA